MSLKREAPPTAGLPLRAADLLPTSGSDLGAALARFLQVPAVQVTCSGTAALVVALKALHARAPQRREVVLPAYTCPLVAMAVAHCRLTVRLCDLQPGGIDLCPAALTALCGPRTLAVLPTHLGGRVADAAPARALAHAAGAWVVEDAAQALGARVGGHCIGTGSDVVFFSLAVGKGLTLFEGGALVVADPTLREDCRRIAREIAPFRLGWELRRSLELLGYAALYRPDGLRWVYGRSLRRALARGDLVEAAGDDFGPGIALHAVGRWRQAVGVQALARLPAWLASGTEQARERAARLRAIAGLAVLGDSPTVCGARGVWPVLLLLLPDRARRDAALQALWGAGVGAGLPFVHALPDYARYRALLTQAAEDPLPNSRDFAGRVLSLGNSPWLHEAQFDAICAVLRRCCA
ncbi:DegT/DnrJ/EryC1/StrS family aminotransferase [Pseudorhodoferax sp. Leaf274]|uniref:DegT/DnrJ/EryC1/StrS family aminotransferase n=1 Tax=Pseudorhodoferax sp. Leaf274 TaxID=1736318 RepID=UPI000702E2C9|nr:DegT/DnrJ/EryC1/StrS family aminotransferase [Pseudorhodoferax sp. Leaf274]KQP48563.1 nucleotide sugar aminotransferase [Pseudorhodoferax sp. Leaf274]